MPDMLRKAYDEYRATMKNPTDYQTFQIGYTRGAVAMRARAVKLAQTKTGNDLINAIGSLSDIPE
jgi:hypothetical protein